MGGQSYANNYPLRGSKGNDFEVRHGEENRDQLRELREFEGDEAIQKTKR